MNNISTFLEKSGEIHNLLSLLDKVLKTRPKALTIFSASKNKFTKVTMNPILKALDIPVSGGIFHKIIYKDQLLAKGSIIVAWYNEIKITNYKNIENTTSIRDLVGTSIQDLTAKDNGEYLIFIDSAVPKLEDNLDVLYKKIGFRASFAGGGAGSIKLKSQPCIFTNDGLLRNVMQTVATNHKAKITTTHGWQKQSGPHLVTSSYKTKIKTLNYEPVIPYFKKHNTLFRNHNLKSTAFSSFFNEYPIGIENIDGELLIREPVRFTEDEIEYIGNIPEYSKIHILAGTKDSSRESVNKELQKLKLKEEKGTDATFIFACAYRDDSDHNGYSKEIKMLNNHVSNKENVIGVMTMGEIATGKSRLLHLQTQSIVISRLSGEQ